MKRVLALSCDAKFFRHAQELISSVHKTSRRLVDEILFFDLGLTGEQRDTLTGSNFHVMGYPTWLTERLYPDFLSPRMFAWKTFVLVEAAKHGDLVLYADSACVLLNSLAPIYEIIEHDEVFMIRDVQRNDERTHEACFGIMNATLAERGASQIDAGVLGYSSGGRFAGIFAEAFEFAKYRNCIFGDATTHRHDQSIYSILAARYAVPSLHAYGDFVHWKGIESREQIVWQHRGKWPFFKRFAERAAILSPARIAIYGAGKHTERFLATFRNLAEPRHRVVGILDDSPRAESFAGVPILQTMAWQQLQADVIVLSSDAHEEAMYLKFGEIAPQMAIWRIYS